MDRGQSRLDIEDLRLKEAPFRTRKALGWMIKDRGWTEKPQDGQNGQLKYQAGRQRTESQFQVCTCFTHTVVLKVCLCMLSLSIPPPSLSHSLFFFLPHFSLTSYLLSPFYLLSPLQSPSFYLSLSQFKFNKLYCHDRVQFTEPVLCDRISALRFTHRTFTTLKGSVQNCFTIRKTLFKASDPLIRRRIRAMVEFLKIQR